MAKRHPGQGGVPRDAALLPAASSSSPACESLLGHAADAAELDGRRIRRDRPRVGRPAARAGDSGPRPSESPELRRRAAAWPAGRRLGRDRRRRRHRIRRRRIPESRCRPCADEPRHPGVHARVGHRHDARRRAAASCRRRSSASPREIWLLQRKPTPPGRDLGKTTGWVHRLALKRRGVRMLAGVAYERIDDRGLAITQGGESRAARGRSRRHLRRPGTAARTRRGPRGRGRQGRT